MKPTDDRSVMTAITLAEAGEWDAARWYAQPPRPGLLRAWMERHLVAAALAEEGLPEEALRWCRAEQPCPVVPGEDALDALLRARGLRMFCGVLSPAALGAEGGS